MTAAEDTLVATVEDYILDGGPTDWMAERIMERVREYVTEREATAVAALAAEIESAVVPAVGGGSERVLRRDIDNFPSEFRISASERAALVELAHKGREATQ